MFTSHLAATLHSMARAGDGVAWLPRTLAEEDISAGLLVEAGDAELAIPIEIRLFRPVARQSRAVEEIWLHPRSIISAITTWKARSGIIPATC